jgi:two-component system phosphate regulon sensor histidine kinase PhoR
MVYRPMRQLRRLIQDLAENQSPTGFVARGAWGLEDSISNLERVSKRLEGISSREESERFSLQAILGSLAEGVMVSDGEGRITLANQAFLQIFELEEIPKGRTVLEVVRLVEVDRAVEEIIRQGATQSLEVMLPSEDSGIPRVFAVNMAPILESGGDRAGVVTIFYDRSKIRHLETVRQEFVTNLSHELRTPLSILAGYLETMENPTMLKGAEGKKILAVLQRNCERMTLLVGDLLELSRIESGRMELKTQLRAPREILDEVREDWSRAFSAKGVKLEIDCGADLVLVQTDPLRTGQIFSNLLENALRFSRSGGRVVLSARDGKEAGQVEFAVEDEGEGIAADKIGRIFERFFRVDPARAREKGGGTGLGLSIVKHLVQLHGGSVRAESESEKGTRIIFTLKNPSA